MQIKDIRYKKPSGLQGSFMRMLHAKLYKGFHLLKKGVLVINREGYRKFLLRLYDYLDRKKYAIIPGIKTDYDRWMRKNKITDIRIGEIKKEIAGFQYKPKIST